MTTLYPIKTAPTPELIECLDCFAGETKDAIILIRETLSLMRSHGQTELIVEYVLPKLKLTVTAKR